jgi:hypothetical protein
VDITETKDVYDLNGTFLYSERYSFKGWVPVNADGSYSVPLWNENKTKMIVRHFDKNGNPLLGWHVDYIQPPPFLLDAATGSCVSATSGTAGIGCIATVIVKRRKGVW